MQVFDSYLRLPMPSGRGFNTSQPYGREYPLPGSRLSPTASWFSDIFRETSAATRSTSGQRPKEEEKTLPVAGFVSVAVLQAACKRSSTLCQLSTNWLTWRTNVSGSICLAKNAEYKSLCICIPHSHWWTRSESFFFLTRPHWHVCDSLVYKVGISTTCPPALSALLFR